jgi:hypothetical protein
LITRSFTAFTKLQGKSTRIFHAHNNGHEFLHLQAGSGGELIAVFNSRLLPTGSFGVRERSRRVSKISNQFDKVKFAEKVHCLIPLNSLRGKSTCSCFSN